MIKRFNPLTILAGLALVPSFLLDPARAAVIESIVDKPAAEPTYNYLSINPKHNRAARRARVKQRHGKGNTAGKREQFLATLKRNAARA